ncbi:hypothetical protein EOE67_07015 [Rheinheimera riviphila]|uniref:Uncharacterized protein n=1 Tax=Rheinheimera riviphila TaxID=1834037 RepID=A0A437R0Q2_9GAMM|nr:hypothetical protein [Rheinheimera riviphila]RVU40339.1 hypothetical protein EOE67_07015 [Rheinheimera riviphila]
MNRAKNTAKDLLCLTVCTLSLAAIFYFGNTLYNYLATTIAILTVGFFSLSRRENLPILLFVIGIQLLEFTLGTMLERVQLLQLTAASLLDLLLAFCIVHYHNDPALRRLFKINEPVKRVPQVYLISLVLAFSSLFSFLMAGEVMFYYIDKNIFNGEVPLFYSISGSVKLTIKVLFDLAIWSLLLTPGHWKFLRRIEQRFDL